MTGNRLYYGDNLDVLRQHIADESVDLIYLDPPFNSNATYNVLFKSHAGDQSRAQIEAFDDTWQWGPPVEIEYGELTRGGAPIEVARFLEAMRTVLNTSDMLAYLVMMAPRLLELRRVLKPTGSIYLHCDPTASHYLKLLMDAIFGADQFRNEVIWRRTGAHAPLKSYGPVHDTLLFYSRTNAYFWNTVRTPYTKNHVETRYRADETGRLKFTSGGNVLTGAGTTRGESGRVWQGFDPAAKNRHWAVPGFLTEQMPPEFAELGVLAKLDALYEAGLVEITPGNAWPVPVRYLRSGDGQPLSDIWANQSGTKGVLYSTEDEIDADVAWMGPTDPERLGYPTQKPLGLLERIVRSSCPENGVVLDPFCGCGTAVDAAQHLGRGWIGIDITYIAIDLITKRLQHRYGDEILSEFTTNGIPTDVEGAAALFTRNPFDFERWAVAVVNGEPNEKQVGDKGIDGRIRFHRGGSVTGLAAVSVKGGHQINPAMVHQLIGALEQERADMGVLITMSKLTTGMVEAGHAAGTYEHEPTGNRYPRVQIITVPDLFDGKRPNMPTVILPYIKARARPQAEAVSLFDQPDEEVTKDDQDDE
jgi:DNA modification methylase